MLEIDDAAVDALRKIGALRITSEEVDGELEVSIDEAEGPSKGDEVVERDGVSVYLDAAASEALADQVLGVHAHGDHFHFTFDDQSPAE
jgi:Fe-S cluster assembly iron-binding protein IscA